ncbi:uncharacterized protein (DUF58 family) [Symbiobacterium terraclitae]|uniref:Uncharacterized protein (DUF58 family) n=1 Tax=Symbiobacterium terraclitae TaxID=557451 RepID=A0ABS4JSZ7_9FIRM|nr:DUF58 domain-containing protein [Symbiobacterium terraclitae]MBP2018654.1 uncharacterized protein (DUF58 family) [Symbiobacterium terraclitae]
MRRGRHDWRLPLLILVAYVSARVNGGSHNYFLLYATALLWAGSWLMTRYAASQVTCTLAVDRDRIEVGETITAKLRLENEGWVPILWLEVDDDTPPRLLESDRPRLGTTLPLAGCRLVHVNLTARRRGRCHVGPIRIRTGDGLGLFAREIMLRSRQQITIYPRVHPIDDLRIPLAQPFGHVRTPERAFEDPSNHAEIRHYVPGDNPRHIHWRTTARMGTLMTRQYELSATTQLILFLDLNRDVHVDGSASGGGSSAETAVEIAASLAALALRSKMEAGLVCMGQERFAVSPGRGDRTFQEIMEVLAQVEAEGDMLMEQLLEAETAHLGHRATLVVITPRLTQLLADRLLRLRVSHRVMLILLDADTFAGGQGAPQQAAPAAAQAHLAELLALRRVTVYRVPCGADLRQLASMRLQVGEGVGAWSPRARPQAIS